MFRTKMNFTAWCAGFYEAEGTIGTDGRVSLYQNDRYPLDYMQEVWGGKIVKRVRKSPASDKICTGYELHFTKAISNIFLEDISSYCLTPRKIENIIDRSDIQPSLENVLEESDFLSYTAGFYEGDGCIFIDVANSNAMSVNIDQQTLEPLHLFKEKWGGFIKERSRKSPASDKMCQVYTWVIKSKATRQFIEDIKDHMIIPYKIEQMDAIIEKSKTKSDKLYKCNLCDKTFSNAPNRRRHEKTHDDNTIFACTECDKTYKSSDALKYHIESTHSLVEDKPTCRVCNKTYSTQLTLDRHNKKFHSTLLALLHKPGYFLYKGIALYDDLANEPNWE